MPRQEVRAPMNVVEKVLGVELSELVDDSA
jgi:hypothetical protein